MSDLQLVSVGSRLHYAGRCKPCAFFHTKGCTSNADCLFCHVCPAQEKQRRKRLRRQLCHNILASFDARKGKAAAGHARQRSDTSTASASTCCPPSPVTDRLPSASSSSDFCVRAAGSVGVPDAVPEVPSLEAVGSMAMKNEAATLPASASSAVEPTAIEQQPQVVSSLRPSARPWWPSQASRACAVERQEALWQQPLPTDAAPLMMPPLIGEGDRAGGHRVSLGTAHAVPQYGVASTSPTASKSMPMSTTPMPMPQSMKPAGYMTCNGVSYALVPMPATPQQQFCTAGGTMYSADASHDPYGGGVSLQFPQADAFGGLYRGHGYQASPPPSPCGAATMLPPCPPAETAVAPPPWWP